MTGEADPEALDADTPGRAPDQMIDAEKAATTADVVMTAVSVGETAVIVPIAELTETTDGQDRAPLVGIAAAARLVGTTEKETRDTSRATTPRPRSTTTTSPAQCATIE